MTVADVCCYSEQGCPKLSSTPFALFEDCLAPPGAPSAWLFTGLVREDNPCPAELDGALNDRQYWTVAAIDYELGALYEPSATGRQTNPQHPRARLWRFAECRMLSPRELEDWMRREASALTPDERLAGIGGLTCGIDDEACRQAVERIKNHIAAGDCYQVNFTFPLDFIWFGAPLALYAALRQRQPVRYGGFVSTGKGAIVSLSPELFLERRGNRLTTRPMKGTAPRHGDPSLLQDCKKNRAENLMIVDLLRSDLGRIAETGSVRVDSLFEIEDYPTVRQMVSQVSARLGPQTTTTTILSALFPCGSITGAPKVRAMQVIGELEDRPRGLYTGALGWLSPNGDLRLNVAIRTLELEPGQQGKMGIGSGIVSDSDPAAEWQECRMKAAFLADFDPGFVLIETLLLADGCYPRLNGHLARLQASAGWLGFRHDPAAVRSLLDQQPKQGNWRIRLTLGKNGDLQANATALPAETANPRFALLSPEAIDSAHPLRHHKTSVRHLYDQALQSIVEHPDIFDVVFCNERGEVAEGARSTVFVARDNRLLTPPLASGALPGVLRAELLSSGQAREALLHPADLANGFFLGNAVRGLIEMRLTTLTPPSRLQDNPRNRS